LPSTTPAPSGSPALASPPAQTPTPAATPTPGPTPAAAGEAIQGIQLRFFGTPAALESAYAAGALDAAVGLPAADATTLAATPGSRLVRYPLTTLTAIVLNQRAGQPFRDATLRRALVEVVGRSAIIRDVLGGLATEASSPIPPTSWAFNAAASAAVPFDRAGAAADLRKAGWRKVGGAWAPPGSKTPLKLTVISVDTATNQVVRRTAAAVVASWKSFGFKVSFKNLPPADIATQLQAGSFSVAILDVNVGLDPDLYPLFASSQATSKGSNVIGVQDQALDAKLAAARAPGSLAARQKAYRALQAYLSQAQLMPALFFRDEPVVLSNRVVGPTPNPLGGPGDRFWDVLTWRLASGR
jgi:ABC-type transport system substrate-binding protein